MEEWPATHAYVSFVSAPGLPISYLYSPIYVGSTRKLIGCVFVT